PRPVVRILQESPGTALIDGDGGSGQVVGVRAMNLAIDKAKATGVGYVGVRSSDHFGTCAYYAEMALTHDMIGFVSTVGGFNMMAPWGGITPLLGSNPFALAVPAGKQHPVVLDMACTATLTFAIARALQSGSSIPPTWAFNKYGEPTTNPVEAAEGLVQPIGGHKGSGLALVIGLLSGVLNGAAFGKEMGTYPGRNNSLRNTGGSFAALDVSLFMTPTEFKERVDAAIAEMRSSELARGVQRIYMPGEIELTKRTDHLQHGIPISPKVWQSLDGIARELGVPMPDCS
ncbi:MAG: Ldh family oxidoreductase, partial [Chloroflexota bacterium]